MGLCSSNQRRLAVTPEQHQLKELRTYSDTQARTISKQNAQIIEQGDKIEAQHEDLVEARKALKSTAQRLKAQQELHKAREERHLDDFQQIVRAVSAAAKGFTVLKPPAPEADTPPLSSRPGVEQSLSPLRLP